jgi:hypothetical protein
MGKAFKTQTYMIKAEELMIGNWVKHNDSPSTHEFTNTLFQISVDFFYDLARSHISEYNIEPIPLTSDILSNIEEVEIEKIWNGTAYKFDVGDFVLSFNFFKSAKEWVEFKILGNGGYDDGGEMDITETCKYLHQLQNLYYSLTQNHLTIQL